MTPKKEIFPYIYNTKKDTILCLLLEKDSPEQDNNEDVFIAFIDKNHAEIRLNHPTTGANLDNIEEGELFRINRWYLLNFLISFILLFIVICFF